MDSKTKSYVSFGLGALLFVVGGVLAAQGTTEIGLFVFYILMIFAGIGLIALGRRFAAKS